MKRTCHKIGLHGWCGHFTALAALSMGLTTRKCGGTTLSVRTIQFSCLTLLGRFHAIALAHPDAGKSQAVSVVDSF